MTTTQTTLALVRGENVTFVELASVFGRSITFIAGLIEAVNNDTQWLDSVHDDEDHLSRAEADDYHAGLMVGWRLLDEEARDAAHGTLEEWAAALDAEAAALEEGWAECYGLAKVEAIQAAEQLPVCDEALPW